MMQRPSKYGADDFGAHRSCAGQSACTGALAGLHARPATDQLVAGTAAEDWGAQLPPVGVPSGNASSTRVGPPLQPELKV